MLDFFVKKRAKKGLSLAGKAIASGSFYSPQEAESWGLNERATAYLYTEAHAHQLYAVALAFTRNLQNKIWAQDIRFFSSGVIEGVSEIESVQGLSRGDISRPLLHRVVEIESKSPKERQDGSIFVESAERVYERDHLADIKAIAKQLQDASKEVYDIADKRFFE